MAPVAWAARTAASRAATRSGRSTRPQLVCFAVTSEMRSAECRRSGSYESSTRSSTVPWITPPSFQARFTASWMPVFMPWEPAALKMCAASPTRKQRPARKAAAVLRRAR